MDENDFRHYHGIFFEYAILTLPDHSYIRSHFTIIMRYFGNGI